MRIIAVDDEKGALNLILRAIKKEAPESSIQGFDDAKAAILNAEKESPDVAFLDIRMAEISGLDMAPRLKKINPEINIIYVTGYSEHAADAFSLRASGYIMKPVSREEVRRELENLRNPVKEIKKQIRFVTFGGFDAYIGGKALSFSYRKTKELLAFLFNKQGAMSTVREIEAALWESDGHDSYLRRLKIDLIDRFKEEGYEELVISRRGEIGLDVSEIESDYKDFLKGDTKAMDIYNGNYMSEYSWAEERNAMLAGRKQI